ncbi:MAG: hypothetical protein H5T33_08345, partial [Candidatus Methanosuratus sp.]|nr:hypothetical protein [Candidatus Methanosuratincola sp.]
QLNVEKQGIPTVTIATSAFEEMVRQEMEKYGAGNMALVVVEHPIAGRSEDGIRKMAEDAFPAILDAATK